MFQRKIVWQFKFRNWIGASTHGLMFMGARPRSRGPWLTAEQLPSEVRQYLEIVKSETGRVWTIPLFKTIQEFKERALVLKLQRANVLTVKGLFEIERVKPVLPPAIDVNLPRLMNEIQSLDSTVKVEKLFGVEGKRVVVEITGYTVFKDPSYECEFDLSEEEKSSYQMSAHAIVCDAEGNGEWTGDDWIWSFREYLRIRVVHKCNVVDYPATARRIVRAATKEAEWYRQSWKATDEALDELYRSMEENHKQ
jgi:hypothetical protein